MTDTYFLALKPLTPVYFGGEHGETSDDYYLKTRLFPQQSTVLGMLRYELLRSNGQLVYRQGKGYAIADASKAGALIGEESFHGRVGQDFGYIRRISPVFLRFGQEPFFLIKDARPFQVATTPGRTWTSNGQSMAALPYLPGFDTKKGHLSEVFLNEKHEALHVFPDQDPDPEGRWAFHVSTKIGITKNYKQQPKEDGFFKMELLHLHPKADYACYVELEAGTAFMKEDKQLVYLGGNRSPFLLTCEKAEDFFPEGSTFRLPGRSVLLSDAWVEKLDADVAALTAADLVIFRNLKTRIDQEESYHQKPVGAAAHTPRLLLARGGVFFQPDDDKLTTLLDQSAFKTIGYNYFSHA